MRAIGGTVVRSSATLGKMNVGRRLASARRGDVRSMTEDHWKRVGGAWRIPDSDDPVNPARTVGSVRRGHARGRPHCGCRIVVHVCAAGVTAGQAVNVPTRLVRSLVLFALLLAACGTNDAAESDVASTDSGVPSGASTEPSSTFEAAGIDDPPVTTPAPTRSTTESVVTTTSLPLPTATTMPATTTSVLIECERLEDFDNPRNWFVVNDGVMGGRSAGQGAIGDSVLGFTGTVITAGGGFTSVRLALDDGELAGTDRIRVRLRRDARTYGLTLEDDQAINGRRVSHRADLPAAGELDGEGFAVVELPHSVLEPTIFGQRVAAEPFRPDTASEIGIIIADGVDGDFAVEIDWIDGCG